MAVTKKKYKMRMFCKNETCKKMFYSLNFKRKYCCEDCSSEQQSRKKIGENPNDPTPEEIAEMCRQIRSGELIIHSAPERRGAPRRPRIMANWVLEKRLK